MQRTSPNGVIWNRNLDSKDAIFKIDCICDQNMVIPEHIDITGEIDKQLERVAAAEDKVAALRKHYVKNKA